MILYHIKFYILYNKNFAIMLSDFWDKYEINNHFEALLPKDGYYLDKNKIQKIKEKLCNIKPDNIDK